jgi:hypothetical protein
MWKEHIDEMKDFMSKAAGGKAKKIGLRKIQRMTINKMLDMADHFGFDVTQVMRYHQGLNSSAKAARVAGESMEKLIHLGKRAGLSVKSKVWWKFVKKGVLKGVPVACHIVAAWGILNFASDPKAAIADELDISVNAVDKIYSGRMHVEFGEKPKGAMVNQALLRDGSLIYIGQDLFSNRYDSDLDDWVIHTFTVKSIQATGTPGLYRLYHGPGGREITTLGTLNTIANDEDD